MTNPINQILRHAGFEIHRAKPALYREFVSLKADTASKGSVLLAYIVEPFLLKDGESPSPSHTNHTESLLMAQAFLSRGYDVDVIDFRNTDFKPLKHYRVFVSARVNFVKLAQRLNTDCIKIAHLDTAHFLFNNAAAYRRLLELQQRRGITNTSIRIIEHNYAVEHADYLTMLGNDFTRSTYSYAGKPIYRLSVPTPNRHPLEHDKDFSKVKNHFLWLGSSGLVHKGLDLVLEVFSEMPECYLTVCGPLDGPDEKAFRHAYQRELYETPNINAVGWVDVSSQMFVDIASSCSALIYPSCAEGQAGGVVTCLQAGLIPLISNASGVDVDDYGVILNNCSKSEIRQLIQEFSSKADDDLAEMSRRAYAHAQQHHGRESYLRDFGRVVDSIEKQESQTIVSE